MLMDPLRLRSSGVSEMRKTTSPLPTFTVWVQLSRQSEHFSTRLQSGRLTISDITRIPYMALTGYPVIAARRVI